MLSTRVQGRIDNSTPEPGERAIRDHYRKYRDTQFTAFAKFIRAYNLRWRSRTVCAPRVATDRCSNGEKMDLPSEAETNAPAP